jgi:hypothetical protein
MALSEEQKARKRALFTARNRAQSVLIQRHYEEFTALKDEFLVRSGHQPIEQSRVHRTARVTEATSIDTAVTYPSEEVSA